MPERQGHPGVHNLFTSKWSRGSTAICRGSYLKFMFKMLQEIIPLRKISPHMLVARGFF